MSYTNETTYFGLPLPTGSDKSTFTDNNTAFQAVDAALHTAYEQSGAATEDIVAIKATVANLIQADVDFQNDLDTEKGKIRNLQDKEVLQDAEIAAVKADSQDMITAYNEPTATSTHAYNVGDFFIYNDVLYRATASIAIGDTIVPDTNCTTTNVTSQLLSLYKELEPTDLTPIWYSVHYTNRKIWLYRVGKMVYYNIGCTADEARTAGPIVAFANEAQGVNGIKPDQTGNTQAQRGFMNIVRGSSNIVRECYVSLDTENNRININSEVPLEANDAITITGYFRTN